MSALNQTYDGIFLASDGSRPFMSRPPRLRASKKLIAAIEDARRENPTPEAFADWLANYMEEYAAHFAEPVFDMEGNGPKCSFCGLIWPLCGHHLMSAMADDPTEHSDPA